MTDNHVVELRAPTQDALGELLKVGARHLLAQAVEAELAGGHGKDTLEGGNGDDHDAIRFGSDIAVDDLWFSRRADDLWIQLIDNDDRVLVKQWFNNDKARIDEITTAGGDAILADQVEALIGEIATFDVQRAGRVRLTAAQQSEYAALMASHWQQVSGQRLDSGMSPVQ